MILLLIRFIRFTLFLALSHLHISVRLPEIEQPKLLIRLRMKFSASGANIFDTLVSFSFDSLFIFACNNIIFVISNGIWHRITFCLFIDSIFIKRFEMFIFHQCKQIRKRFVKIRSDKILSANGLQMSINA